MFFFFDKRRILVFWFNYVIVKFYLFRNFDFLKGVGFRSIFIFIYFLEKVDCIFSNVKIFM